MEYSISKESVRRWCNEFQKECQAQSLQISSSANEAEIMKDNLRLRRELAEKEILLYSLVRPKDVGRILRTFKIKKNVEVTDNGKDDF